MRRLLIILIMTSSCSRPTETNQQSNDAIKIESQTAQYLSQKNFPDYVKETNLPDRLRMDENNVIYGDFNADGKEDFASIVTNLENGFNGVLIIHDNDYHEFYLFGAGKEVHGMKNLDWIDIFKTLPIGEVIAPTLVDSETGDIIGPDKTKEFKLIGNGIFMHVDESEGGGIIYWTGDKYDWCHVE